MIERPYNSDSDNRYALLIQWLNEVDIEHSSVTAASADASFRRYFRVFTANESFIAVDAPPKQNDNAKFIDVSKRLAKAGIYTPKVICYSLENGFLLLEDLGTKVLQQVLIDTADTKTHELYTEAINIISTMQSTAATDGLPLYNATLLKTELQLFPDWYLRRHLGHNPSCSDLDIINELFTVCIKNALEQPQAFVHRDYHCRNLMPLSKFDNSKADNGKTNNRMGANQTVTGHNSNQANSNQTMGIIDFQDAVFGPITYDPVSLLKDAYIDWPEKFIIEFTNQHRLSLNPVPDLIQYNRWFDLMGLQRHLKILGIFCRLNYRDGKPQYLDDLPLVLQHIDRTLVKYPELAKFRQLLQTISTVKSNSHTKAATP